MSHLHGKSLLNVLFQKVVNLSYAWAFAFHGKSLTLFQLQKLLLNIASLTLHLEKLLLDGADTMVCSINLPLQCSNVGTHFLEVILQVCQLLPQVHVHALVRQTASSISRRCTRHF